MNFPSTEPSPPFNRRMALSLPEGMVSLLTFVCCFAVVALAFAPSLATLHTKHGDGALSLFFGSMMAIIAFANTFLLRKSRRDDQTRFALTQDSKCLQKTPKQATSLYGGFAVIGVMFFVTTARAHGNWPLFVECSAGQLAAFLLLRWTLLRPPTAAQAAASTSVEWLPKHSLARATSTEIVLAMPWGARAFIGGFALVMAAATVMCLLLAFAPDLFGPPSQQPGGIFRMTMPLCLFVGMAFFTTLILGSAGPRDLHLELDTRRYSQTFWKPWTRSSSKDGFCIPFCTVHASGRIDDDMLGVCIREHRYKGTTSYLVQIAWRDTTKAPQVLNRFTVPEAAQIALDEAAQALRLPRLERCS